MGVATAPGHPALSGVSIPEMWSTKLLVKFYFATVLAAITNTDYEGEIKKEGDQVKIRTTPDINILNYNKGGSLIHQRPLPTVVELDIDKAKYFDFIVDDIDSFQADYSLSDDWTEDASQQMKIVVDQEVLGDVYTDADSNNAGATAGKDSGDINLGATGAPLAVTQSTVLEILVDVGTVLDEQNVPEEDRNIVIPPWMAGKIKKSDLKDASLAGDDTSIIRNGRLGEIDRLMLYNSNLLTKVADSSGKTATHVIACQRHAITFAAQIVKSETLRGESTFGDIVRGLNVYGYKVLKDTALVDLYVYKG